MSTPTNIVVDLAKVPDLVAELGDIPAGSDRRTDIENQIRAAVVAAVAHMTGHDS